MHVYAMFNGWDCHYFVQENIVNEFLDSKNTDTAIKAIKDIKGPRYEIAQSYTFVLLTFYLGILTN